MARITFPRRGTGRKFIMSWIEWHPLTAQTRSHVRLCRGSPDRRTGNALRRGCSGPLNGPNGCEFRRALTPKPSADPQRGRATGVRLDQPLSFGRGDVCPRRFVVFRGRSPLMLSSASELIARRNLRSFSVFACRAAASEAIICLAMESVVACLLFALLGLNKVALVILDNWPPRCASHGVARRPAVYQRVGRAGRGLRGRRPSR